MADQKISAMTAASALAGTETVPVLQSSANRRTTAQAIGNLGVLKPPVGSLTDGASIAVNAAATSVFRVTLAGNRVLENPTGLTDGQRITFFIKQDGVGGRTLSFDTGGIYTFPGASYPILSTDPAAVDKMECIYDSATGFLYCEFAADFH
jgi:hypothetical protein